MSAEPVASSGGCDTLASIDADAAAIDAVAGQVALESSVPTCPGWTVADLLYHCGVLLELWNQVIERDLPSIREVEWTARPDDAGVRGYFVEQAAIARRVLAETPADRATWTFWGTRDVQFVRRRVAQELAVHRVDAQSATRREPDPIDPLVAADGIDERLTVFTKVQPEGSVHVHCTDTEGEWLVVPGPEGAVVTREHAKGDAALRGPASDLLLVLWNRKPLRAVETRGDAAMVQRYLEASQI